MTRKTEHPSRNLFKALNVKLPWDTIRVGESFFLRECTEDKNGQAIKMAASRRGFTVTVQDAHEADGQGIRVKRVG